MSSDLDLAQGAVLVKSCEVPQGAKEIRGYDFNQGVDFDALMKSYMTTGFQASHMAQAIEEINRMLETRASPFDLHGADCNFEYPVGRPKTGCTIFLGYTSNLVSSGLSAGGVEEDLIKCLAPSYLGAFKMDGKELRSRGINRAGNVLIPNDNYCAFEDWLNPILERCVEEQENDKINWTPSKLIRRLGFEINHEDSILYWASKNSIPVFCPALTDGSLGDMLYFFNVKASTGIRLDIVEDVRHINTLAVKSVKSGVIILGGGVVKHHINNANLMRNGSDYTVYINTGQEFDGSDSGAQPDEAISWGKVKPHAAAVKVFAEATLVFPLIVSQTFAKIVHSKKE